MLNLIGLNNKGFTIQSLSGLLGYWFGCVLPCNCCLNVVSFANQVLEGEHTYALRLKSEVVSLGNGGGGVGA